jgi:indolepyruvate ferredoxin oxidoreductase alpha subunit
MDVGVDPADTDDIRTISISEIIRACGAGYVIEVDPLDHRAATAAVREAVAHTGVSVVVFTSPCVNLGFRKPALTVDTDTCNNCKTCILALGCPSLLAGETSVSIDRDACTGCQLCAQVCPNNSIVIPQRVEE